MAYTFKHGDRPLEGVTIQRAVGRGGFGEVYYAKTDSGKEIALKYLRENPEVELRGVAQVMNLKSPHLITIYDVRRNGEGDPFVMMEYVSGPSLHELMTADSKGLGVQKAAFFLNGIAKGLSYLHDRGIVHRDLKPGNIFYDEGYVKIGDYGLSKHLSVSRHSGNTVSVGTVHYMAPEIGSGSYTKAIDIYALGVILYEMLTGRLPFTGSSMAEILMRHLQDRPDVGAIPEPFKSVILRALQKNPGDRYQDVNEMVDAIMSSTEVTAGFNSFDPSVLASNYQRGGAPDELDRTVTTPPRRQPVPPLDVHGAVPFPAGTPDIIPDIPPLPDEARHPGRRPAAPHGPTPYVMPSGLGTWLSDSARNIRMRWPVALSFAVILIAASGLAGSVDRARDAAPLSIGWFLLSGTFAALFAQLSVIPRAPEQNPLVERIMTASIAGAMMIPGAMIGGGDNIAFAMPILATLAINNWRERVAQGRRGEVRIWSAAGPAFVGFLAALPFARRDDEMKLAFAISGAALSLLVQLGASLWAMPRPAPPRRPVGGRPIPPIPPTAGSASPTPAQPPAASTEPGGSAGPFTGAAAVRGISVRLTSFQNMPSWIQPRPAGALVPQGLRVVWAVLLCLAVAGAVAGFVARGVAARTVDDKVGTMALGFGGVAACILFAIKLGQKHRRTLIGGTIRPFVLSFAVFIVGLMIAILSSEPRLDGEEIAGCVFGMVAAAGIAVVSLAFRWERGARTTQPAGESAPPPQPAAPAEPAEPAAAPSFVGRATNAGLSFLGKMLLVASLAMAVLYNVRDVSFRGEHAVVSANNGRVEIVNRRGEFIEAQVPRAAVLGPLLFGTVLLMVSRRSDGGMHFLRGLVGCGLGLVAVVLCLGPAANALSILLTEHDWDDMARTTNPSPLIVAGLAGFASMGLLLWPKRRAGRTIVI